MAEADLQHRREVAEAAVRAAAEVLMRRLNTDVQAQPKDGDNRDLVTEADLEAQAAIREVLETALPGEKVVSEEDGIEAEELRSALDACWLIDPLDGTLNFVHSFPMFGPAVSWVETGRPLVAAAGVPAFGEVFSAARGQGATLNGSPISVAAPRRLDMALVASNIRNASPDKVSEFMRRVQGWRLPSLHGSPLLVMCYVAAGRLDAFLTLVSSRLGPWDLAPGALMVEEAGGVVRGHLGSAFDLIMPGMAGASCDALLDEILAAAGAGPEAGRTS